MAPPDNDTMLAVTEAVIEENFPEDGPRTSEIAAGIEWSVASHAIGARFTNHADTTAMIVWANATIADESGEEVPLVRVTSPASGPELPQPPTNVPAGGSVAFDCFPVSLAEFEWHPNRSMGGFWRASKAPPKAQKEFLYLLNSICVKFGQLSKCKAYVLFEPEGNFGQ